MQYTDLGGLACLTCMVVAMGLAGCEGPGADGEPDAEMMAPDGEQPALDGGDLPEPDMAVEPDMVAEPAHDRGAASEPDGGGGPEPDMIVEPDPDGGPGPA